MVTCRRCMKLELDLSVQVLFLNISYIVADSFFNLDLGFVHCNFRSASISHNFSGI